MRSRHGHTSREPPHGASSRPLLYRWMECCPVPPQLAPLPRYCAACTFNRLTGTRQNSLGNVVLHNRQNNEFQLSTNAHTPETAVSTNGGGGLCPTCHRPITNGSDHSDSFTPSFMDMEYFRLLSSLGSDAASDEGNGAANGIEDTATPVAEDESQKPSGSLPSSAFNQGYFQR